MCRQPLNIFIHFLNIVIVCRSRDSNDWLPTFLLLRGRARNFEKFKNTFQNFSLLFIPKNGDYDKNKFVVKHKVTIPANLIL